MFLCFQCMGAHVSQQVVSPAEVFALCYLAAFPRETFPRAEKYDA